MATGEQREAAFEANEEHVPETELQRRLRALRWPEPPVGARERGLDALRPHLERLRESHSPGDGTSSNGD